ncbi:MAG: flagellar motor switch protein FliN [Planctomycetes bacterium]|nr:flagellar motor switch protein FliN [Planctomycetota bacterium]NOG53580.1 flagellar motor switch protein FliN [Planctomycetota bacterium]
MADAGEAAEQALSAAQQAVDDLSGSDDGGSLQLPEFGNAGEASLPLGIELLSQVNLNVRIELGRSRMLVEDVLRLNEGSVVELDKLAGDPVDVYVNDRHVARGEVLVLNDSFCVRINEIVTQPRGITRQVVEPEEMAG